MFVWNALHRLYTVIKTNRMDPWQELGVKKFANESEIKHAYRKLVLQFHPDRHASSSAVEREAAAARFKVITEAYDILTDGRARSSYQASSSSSSTSRGSYRHHNVNTDWSQSHYTGGSGYTSTISRWEFYRRLARHGVRSFGQTLHISLAVLLVGGGLMFEYSHSALWQARNKGKSFEEMQASVKAQQQLKANGSGSSNGSSAVAQAPSMGSGSEPVQDKPRHISLVEGLRARFGSADELGSAAVQAAGPASSAATASSSR